MKRLRLGLDVDGVLADFSGAFLEIANRLAGTSYKASTQKDWEFTQFSHETVNKAWDEIRNTQDFWSNLDRIPGGEHLAEAQKRHTLIFVTNRVPSKGLSIEEQTAGWLRWLLRIHTPTVLVPEHWYQKLDLYRALNLDAYIDDRPHTVAAFLEEGLNIYKYAQPYNTSVIAPTVQTVNEYLETVEAKLG